MEHQLNTFSEGLTSDLSPLYVKNTQWTFPTVNARFIITDKGLSVVNVEGNTNSQNTSIEGAEFAITTGYNLIGAYSCMGIGFFFSVSDNGGNVEIGTFPSFVNGSVVRQYQVLGNINDNLTFNVSNIFNWSVEYLLQVEGKVEYDGTLNMYVVSGEDVLRCFNSGFSLYDGTSVPSRYYDLSDIDEQTMVISAPTKAILSSVITTSNFNVAQGGNLYYGVYMFYIRFIDSYKNVTPWLYEIGPVVLNPIIDGVFNIGDLWKKQSDMLIEMYLNVSTAYNEVEVGVVMYSDAGLNSTSKQYEGIFTNKFKITSSYMKITIQTIDSSLLESWNVLETEALSIERIPQTIATIDNRLWTANFKKNVIPLEVIRGFCEKVKLKCVVDPKLQLMPTDDKNIDSVHPLTDSTYKTSRRYDYLEQVIMSGVQNDYTRYYYTAQEDPDTSDVILNDEALWEYVDESITPSANPEIYVRLTNVANPTYDLDATIEIAIPSSPTVLTRDDNVSPLGKSKEWIQLQIVDATLAAQYDMYITVNNSRNNLDAMPLYQTTPMISFVDKSTSEEFFFGSTLQLNKTLVLTNSEDPNDNKAGFPIGSSDIDTITLVNTTYALVDMSMLPLTGYTEEDQGKYINVDNTYYPYILQYQTWEESSYVATTTTEMVFRIYKLADVPTTVVETDVLWLLGGWIFSDSDEMTNNAYDFTKMLVYSEVKIIGIGAIPSINKTECDLYSYFLDYNRGTESGLPVKTEISFIEKQTQMNESLTDKSNDGYYSDGDHIIEDVGYFGGEIYAYSIMAVDNFGNNIGCFAPTGIDHYYANTLSSLEYTAYDSATWELSSDIASEYSLTGNDRLFTKNKKGIYRFPSRSNYKLSTDRHNNINYDEENAVAIDNGTSYANGIEKITIDNVMERDPFNLTHRVFSRHITDDYWGSMANGNHAYVSTLNIFKIAFDFTEAWSWARQKGYEKIIRNNIASFKFLRAERVENLQTQGIIQKPNTILPYPKYYEWETLSLPSGSGSMGPMSHESFSRIISYNFDFIDMPTMTTGDALRTYTARGRGQLVNSSIKYMSSLWNYYNPSETDRGSDLFYPYSFGDGLINENDMLTDDVGQKYRRQLDTRAFVYSGKWSIHQTSYNWDIRDSLSGGDLPYMQQPTTPGLGGVGYVNIVNSVTFDYGRYQTDYPHAYFKGVSDMIWGEMSFPQSIARIVYPYVTDPPGFNPMFRFPYPDVFFDPKSNSDKSLSWYSDYISSIPIAGAYKNQSQYVSVGLSAMLAKRSMLKIPFFKGHMPCMSVGNRRLDKGENRSTRYYTSRCMYFPYDKTRAFFSSDNVMSNMGVDMNNYNFIKPIRKTLYSGTIGYTKHNSLEAQKNNIIREDGWKTFFAKPSPMQLRGRTIKDNENFSLFYDYNPEEYNYPFHISVDLSSTNDISNASGYLMAAGVTPVGVLHSIRKYFKVEDPREICPIGGSHIVSPYTTSGDDKGDFLPSQRYTYIDIPPARMDITSQESNKETYIAGAYDIYDKKPLTQIYGKGYNVFNSTTGDKFYKAIKDLAVGRGEWDILWMTSEVKVESTGEKGAQYFSSNRNFQFVPYISLSFNTEGKSAQHPSSDIGYLNYVDYMNDINNKYLLLTRKDMTSIATKWYKSDDSKSTSIDTRTEFSKYFSVNTDTRDEAKYHNQYNDLDVFIDTNYEDLTLCNIYKIDPENIIDITSFYNIYNIPYYEIGKVSKDTIYSDNKAVMARGDCFLDRTYFKHTTWRDSGAERYVYADDLTRNGHKKDVSMTSNVLLNRRIGAVGSADDVNSSYKTLRGMASMTYAHGVVLGLITENKYNIALRGSLELVDSATGFYNYYPLSNLASGRTDITVTNVRIGDDGTKNAFMLYPDEAYHDLPMIEDKKMNFSYSKVLGNIAYYIADSELSDLKTSYRTRHRWSAKSIEGSYSDGWKIWNYADYIDFPQKYGEIKRLIVFNDTLFSFLNDAYFQHMFIGEQVQVTDEQYLTVGGTQLLSTQVGIVDGFGLSHKFGVLKTDSGIYAVDMNRDLIYYVGTEKKINGSMGITAPANLLKTNGINMWAKSYFSAIRETIFGNYMKVSDRSTELPDSLFMGNGVTIGYDRKYNEILFTFRYRDQEGKVKGVTLVQSELFGKFTSLYTIKPYFMFSINDDLYSVINTRYETLEQVGVRRSNTAWRHNNEWSDRQLFYNEKPSEFNVSFYVNGLSEDKNLGPFAKQFEALSIESQQTPFTKITYKTKDQDSDTLFIDEAKYWTLPEYISHHWQVPIRLDNTSIDEGTAAYGDDLYYKDSSMVGDWLKVTIAYMPGITDEIKEIFITSVLSTFSLSKG